MIYLRLTVSVCVLFNIGIEAFLFTRPPYSTRKEEQQQHPHPLHGGLYLETEVQVQSVVCIPWNVRTVKRRSAGILIIVCGITGNQDSVKSKSVVITPGHNVNNVDIKSARGLESVCGITRDSVNPKVNAESIANVRTVQKMTVRRLESVLGGDAGLMVSVNPNGKCTWWG